MTVNKGAGEAANPSRFNIEAIAKLEHEALERRTTAERVSDAIAKFIGSIGFLLLQALLVLTWSAINLRVIPGVKPFDPFPFGILALIISSESVLLDDFCAHKSKPDDATGGKTLPSGSSGWNASRTGTHDYAPDAAQNLPTPGH
jgi:Protein of unknown function (DUF1003)